MRQICFYQVVCHFLVSFKFLTWNDLSVGAIELTVGDKFHKVVECSDGSFDTEQSAGRTIETDRRFPV